MRTFLIFLSLIITLPLFSQTTIHIPFDYPTIQGGLNAAAVGDTVLVAPGIYYENIVYPTTQGVKFFSSDTRENTIIDGNGAGNVITISNNISDIVIRGFTIRNGARGIWISSSNPIIEDAIISDNSSGLLGGGVYIEENSSPIMNNVIISRNNAALGGGIFSTTSSNLTLSRVTIIDNSAAANGNGGGIYFHTGSTAILDEVIVDSNTAGQWGGGIVCYNSGVITLTNVSVTNNYAGWDGGGICLIKGSIVMSGGSISGNRAVDKGDGIYFDVGTELSKINSCNFIGNNIAIYNNNTEDFVDARNNYFGDASGPYHPTQNPTGLGDSVNLYVRISPWLTEPFIYSRPIISVTPSTLNFGEVKVGEEKKSELIVKNVGTETLTLSEVVNNSPEFRVIYYDIEFLDIHVGDSILIPVIFEPSDSGIFNDTISIHSNDETTPYFLVPLEGKSIYGPGPSIAVTPNKVDFGPTTIDYEEQFLLGIINQGEQTLTIFNAQNETEYFYTNLMIEFNISPNDTVWLPVYFKPNELGEFSDTLTLNSNAIHEPQFKVPLEGTGSYPEAPVILNIEDVRNDQGGFVRIEFQKSRYEGIEGDSSIQTYSFWRKIPDSEEWDAVGLFNVIQQPIYYYVAPTLGDSTKDGIFWSTFKVSAHPANPLIYFMSEPDSGYSIDNLAPEVPTGLLAAQLDLIHAVLLDWDENTEKDFSYYAIYKGSDENFEPDSTNLLSTTTDTSFVDTDILSGAYHYKVSAFDYSGNESDFASTFIVVVGVDELSSMPTEYSLEQNYPNPFNPSTTIKYGLPTESQVKISIYSLLGEEIEVLFNGLQKAGYHSVEFEASHLTSGVYFYRIQADNFIDTKKMILMK